MINRITSDRSLAGRFDPAAEAHGGEPDADNGQPSGAMGGLCGGGASVAAGVRNFQKLEM